jgi:NADPH:quinone reductase-like Zn-dependent oxidoreductase
MPKAVQLTAFGGVDQLTIIDVPKPVPAAGEVVVRVVAAGTNPGEISIREGYLKDRWPKAFPFGQGTDFAGRVDAVGAGVTEFAPGDAVLGWSEDRSSQAEYVLSSPERLIPKPPSLDWYRAGSLQVAGTTALAAVRAVALQPGDVVAVSGAAGGVGSIAVQLARRTGARVIGIASDENAAFLQSVGVEHVAYGDELGITPDRIDTIIDFATAAKIGAKTDGSGAANTREALSTLANLIAWGEIVMPIAAIYPFAQLKDAYIELARRKSRGKIVLAIDPPLTEPLHPPR